MCEIKDFVETQKFTFRGKIAGNNLAWLGCSRVTVRVRHHRYS